MKTLPLNFDEDNRFMKARYQISSLVSLVLLSCQTLMPKKIALKLIKSLTWRLSMIVRTLQTR